MKKISLMMMIGKRLDLFLFFFYSLIFYLLILYFTTILYLFHTFSCIRIIFGYILQPWYVLWYFDYFLSFLLSSILCLLPIPDISSILKTEHMYGYLRVRINHRNQNPRLIHFYIVQKRAKND